jgi:hypothetical protein
MSALTRPVTAPEASRYDAKCSQVTSINSDMVVCNKNYKQAVNRPTSKAFTLRRHTVCAALL